MDQTSMILGWLIGRQLAGQRKASKAKQLDMTYLNMDVIAEEATLRLRDSASEHVLPDSSYGALPIHGINIVTSLYNNGHLIVTTDTEDTTV